MFTMPSLPVHHTASPAQRQIIPQPHSSESAIGSIIALCFVMFLAITGNVAIIVIFRAFKRVRKQVTNHFLINLAISDLIVALVTMPMWLLFEINRWRSIFGWVNTPTWVLISTFADISKCAFHKKNYTDNRCKLLFKIKPRRV